MSKLWDRTPFPAELAVPIVVGLALQRRSRRRLPAGLGLLGWPLVAAGVALNAWAVAARGFEDLEHPGRLATNGPYALSRNPMYVGSTVILLGVGLAARSPWVLATLPPSVAMVHRGVLREERQLTELFGDEHTEYARRVPRYLVVR